MSTCFDYSKLGNDYGVSLKFDLSAKDFLNKKIDNDLITEKLSNTKWKFHFHDLYQTSIPKLYNNEYCWNFEKAYLTPVITSIDELKSVTLNDNYSYAILINWRDIELNDNDINNNKKNQINISNPHSLNIQNHSIQQQISKSHKKIHHWRIPLRARIIYENNKNIDNNINDCTYSQFVDWITLKSSTTSRSSSIGLRTNYYNDKYHATPSRGGGGGGGNDNDNNNNNDNKNNDNSTTTTTTKKATFIGCDYKLDNNTLYNEWQLIVITGRREAFDGPDSSFWIGTINKSIRKIGGIRASVPTSCLYSIGSDGNSKETKYCSGKIAKILIFDGILSKPDIQKLYISIFNINDDKIRSLICKSQKWYSISSKRRRYHHHSRHRSNSHNNNKNKLLSPTEKNKKSFEFKQHLKTSSSLTSSSSNSISSIINNINNKTIPITPSTDKNNDSTTSTPRILKLENNNINSEKFDNLLSTKERTESVSSIILDGMDENIRKKIEKQAVINKNDHESVSSSSDDDDNDDNTKKENNINNINNNNKLSKKENKINITEIDSPSTSTIQSVITTPSLSAQQTNDMDIDTSPHHEKLLPQLEADILEQQKIIQQQQKKKEKNNNDPGIIGRFVKNIRNLTASTPLEENEENIIKVIPIETHRKQRKINKNESINQQKKENDIDLKMKSTERHRNDRKSSKGTVKMPPLRDTVQHVVLYETSHRFFLVGSNLECTKYWILKIDRKTTPSSSPSTSPSKMKCKEHRMTSPPIINNNSSRYYNNNNNANKSNRRHNRSGSNRSNPLDTTSSFPAIHEHGQHGVNTVRRPGLHIVEDRTVYNRDQITTILSMIGAGNKSSGGLTQCISGYGILGFIRFLEGYYIVLITERRKVGFIGHHIIYKIEKTAMIPVTPSQLDSAVSKRLRSDETRYKNLFSVIDLQREFYFSYSYDLSRTLQWNMCNHYRSRKPNHIFVWNEFLLKPLRIATQSNTWMLPIIHGYYESKICSIYGREIILTLISRRSKQFAGTRYLKRGINDLGHSANDIETEQILHDRVGGDHFEGQFSSHVQMRASIPLFWVQDSNPMVPKPDIYIQKVDPSCCSIRKHFQSVFRRYGAPILALNLIKHHESHARETIVGKEFKRAMSFINSFLPKDYKISFIAWDFKDCQRHKARSVVDELTKFAEWSLQRTGFFHSNPKSEALAAFARRTHDISWDDPDVQPVRFEDSDEIKLRDTTNTISSGGSNNIWSIPQSILLRAFCKPHRLKRRIYDLGCFQRGVMRANCIDSLDRTNVAQFIVGKCALGYQLYAMGIRDAPWLDRESDFIRVLLQMYERMGDCLALQYGGSQMHRQMKKDHAEARSMAPALYKQKDPGTRPREMFVSFVRHYQNNFQDNVKQDAMNLFLGTFRPNPSVGSYRLWELGSDYYLHNRLVTIYKKIPKSLSQQDQWWISSVLSFNKTFIHCYKYIMCCKQILPPKKTVRLMSNICKSIESAIIKTQKNTSKNNIYKHISYRGITNSYLPIIQSQIIQSQQQQFFQLAFNPSLLTIFDEEMKLQCNKIETISRTPYYAHTVHALFYENPNDQNNNFEKSKISRITPFLRSKKIKNGNNNNNQNNNNNDNDKNSNTNTNDSNSIPYGNTNNFDLTPYVANISSSSMHKLENYQYNKYNNKNSDGDDDDADNNNNDNNNNNNNTSYLSPPSDNNNNNNNNNNNKIRSSSYDFDHSLSASIPASIPIPTASNPGSQTATPRLNNLHSSTMNVLYQDEDMHSQHLPSMTLSAIMQQSYDNNIYQQQQPNTNDIDIRNKDKDKDDGDSNINNNINNNDYNDNNNNNNDNNVVLPKQLRHSRQDSYTHILAMPMQFQPILDSTQEIDFDQVTSIKSKEDKTAKLIDDNKDNDNNNNDDNKSNDDNRRRWRGFFNFFGGGGPWTNDTTLDREKSDQINIKKGDHNINGLNGLNGLNGISSTSFKWNRYGQPDFYYTNDWNEQNELALPKNIFMDKQDFTIFLNQNYGRYELNDYVLSTHECMEQKTQNDFIANVNRISVIDDIDDDDDTKKRRNYDLVDPSDINKCIKSRFKETDIGLSEQDFSAFAKLHASYLNLDEEIKFIEQDNMKKQGYSFYSSLPQNICDQALNPKQLNDDNINDDNL